ncbi:hypothetical protein J4468_00545 [Candidatus Woesearchaeota archaeon]|nr:hypothetical protein [Candidatus Woesearchaeota archaeon]
MKIAIDVPVQKVIEMKRKGMSNQDIIRSLQTQGFSSQQISEAMSQSDVKSGVEGRATIESEMEVPEPSSEYDESAAPSGMQESLLRSDEPEVPAYEEESSTPSYQPRAINAPSMNRIESDQVQALVESIIDEKWQEIVSNIGDISIWKSKMEDDVESLKQEVLRTNHRLETLQTAVLKKVEDYSQSISEFGSDVKAMEKVFEKIMSPLTTNVRELSKITEEFKKKKK